jgi:hypothetical protein
MTLSRLLIPLLTFLVGSSVFLRDRRTSARVGSLLEDWIRGSRGPKAGAGLVAGSSRCASFRYGSPVSLRRPRSSSPGFSLLEALVL